jgi:hypothetical protein
VMAMPQLAFAASMCLQCHCQLAAHSQHACWSDRHCAL